ncbi:hypothetical protein EVAR_103527_1 [Eumeta japonica]|uniref:Uncharacterized protein n=1 Tax=Eumeta variegata TaxID=151549 RepID=A0A4C1YRK2_EUMVA|nr:hypothetical protein EVAR_103527_1 [Eumeta japonica]
MFLIAIPCCARGRPIIVEWERRKAFGGPLSFGVVYAYAVDAAGGAASTPGLKSQWFARLTPSELIQPNRANLHGALVRGEPSATVTRGAGIDAGSSSNCLTSVGCRARRMPSEGGLSAVAFEAEYLDLKQDRERALGAKRVFRPKICWGLGPKLRLGSEESSASVNTPSKNLTSLDASWTCALKKKLISSLPPRVIKGTLVVRGRSTPRKGSMVKFC